MSYKIIASGLKKSDNGQYSSSTGAFVLIFDAVLNVDYSFTSEVTKHPIDTKARVTDHVIHNNDKFSLVGIVSNTPIQEYTGNKFEYSSNGILDKRGAKALKELKKLKDNSEIILLSTDFGDFTSCIITSVSGSLTAETKNAYQISLSLEKVNLVSSTEVTIIENVAPIVSDETNSAASAGNQDKKPELGNTFFPLLGSIFDITNPNRYQISDAEIQAAVDKKLKALDKATQ